VLIVNPDDAVRYQRRAVSSFRVLAVRCSALINNCFAGNPHRGVVAWLFAFDLDVVAAAKNGSVLTLPTEPSAPYRNLLALLISLLVTALYPIFVGPLFGFIFADVDRFAGHIARIVMELSRLLFARLPLVRILVFGHYRTLL
jgi:hypothetical protein